MFPSDESHDQEMKVATVATDPVPPTYPQPKDHESSNPQIKEEEGNKRKLLRSDSNISIPAFPYGSEEPTVYESALSSPRPPPQPHQAQIPTPESPTDDDGGGADLAHPVLEIVEKQELGKAVIVLAVPMGMGLVTTHDSFAKTPEMKVVAVTLCFAFAFIVKGILLRKTYRRASSLVLMAGIALMVLSLYEYLGCILPVYLKWIPIACWFLSVSRLLLFLLPLFAAGRRRQRKWPQKREILRRESFNYHKH